MAGWLNISMVDVITPPSGSVLGLLIQVFCHRLNLGIGMLT